MKSLQEEMAEIRERVRAALESPPDADADRLYHEEQRAQLIAERSERIGSRNLVAEVLAHPNPKEMPDIHFLREVLLDQSPHLPDTYALAKCFTNGTLGSVYRVISAAADPENASEPMPAFLDAWKWVICDTRYVEGSADLQEAYEAQLQDEELQTPKERARDLIRWDQEKAARRNAKWIISVLETLSVEELTQMEQEEGGVTLAIWKRVSPPPPTWIQHISNTKYQWGFVFFKPSLVERRYGNRWSDVWDDIVQNASCEEPSEGERALDYAELDSIHCGGNRSMVKRLFTDHWAPAPSTAVLADDNALRQHFNAYKESLSSPGILRNTFILIDAEPIPRDFGEYDNHYDVFWVWAYDADWKPSEDDAAPDGEKYQGRVKVPINCLDAWFYAARWEGVSLRSMWLKAQRQPQKLWICYSKPLEEWEHESYT